MARHDPTGLIDAARDKRTPIWIRAAGAVTILIVAAMSLLAVYLVVLFLLVALGVVGGE